MLAIWNKSHFGQIGDYESWERALLEDEDIVTHIKAGAFVPINIRSDGAFACEIRCGAANDPADLTSRERQYLVVASEPYLFRSDGELLISGIESIENAPGDGVGKLRLPDGEYTTMVHLVGWDDEPGMKEEDGKPMPTALPDFVLLLNPVVGQQVNFRKKVDTFEKPA